MMWHQKGEWWHGFSEARGVGNMKGRPVLVMWHLEMQNRWAVEAWGVPKGGEGVFEGKGQRRGLASRLASPHQVSHQEKSF